MCQGYMYHHSMVNVTQEFLKNQTRNRCVKSLPGQSKHSRDSCMNSSFEAVIYMWYSYMRHALQTPGGKLTMLYAVQATYIVHTSIASLKDFLPFLLPVGVIRCIEYIVHSSTFSFPHMGYAYA